MWIDHQVKANTPSIQTSKGQTQAAVGVGLLQPTRLPLRQLLLAARARRGRASRSRLTRTRAAARRILRRRITRRLRKFLRGHGKHLLLDHSTWTECSKNQNQCVWRLMEDTVCSIAGLGDQRPKLSLLVSMMPDTSKACLSGPSIRVPAGWPT